ILLHSLPPGPTLLPYTTLFRSLIRNRLVHNPLDQVILDEDLRVVIDSRVNDSNHATVACGEEAPVRPRTLDIAGIPDLNSPTVVLVVGEGTSIDSVSVTRRSRSEEHTSELQSRENIVCRLLL